MQKLEIDYPCKWSYRIIGEDEQMLRKAAASAAGEKEFNLTVSNRSSGGKYQSLNLEIDVKDETERLSILERLKNDAAIKIVL